MIQCSERNGPITGYLVSYGRLQIIQTVEETELQETIKFTAVGLQPRTNYTFMVRGLTSNVTEPSPPATIVASTSVPQGKDV